MTRSGATEQAQPPTTAPPPTSAVLYVYVERGQLTPSVPAERAEQEGRAFASARGLDLTEVITDPYGEADPLHREGWMRVRELASSGAVGTVLVRWPAVIAPEAAHEYRHREIRWLMNHGVTVRYTWPPLAIGGEIK
ncbi:hypothetical protein ACWGI8_03090 [Streptomyces sp. NPDC054841]